MRKYFPWKIKLFCNQGEVLASEIELASETHTVLDENDILGSIFLTK